MTTTHRQPAARGLALRPDTWGPVAIILGLALLAAVPLVIARADILNLLFLVFLYVTLSESWNILEASPARSTLATRLFSASARWSPAACGCKAGRSG